MPVAKNENLTLVMCWLPHSMLYDLVALRRAKADGSLERADDVLVREVQQYLHTRALQEKARAGGSGLSAAE